MVKRIISFMCTIFMVMSLCTGWNSAYAELPEVLKIIVSDDFEDGITDSRIKIGSGGGSVTEENGTLVTRHTNSAATTGFRYYLNEEHSDVKGVIGIEFSLTKEKVNYNVPIRIKSGDKYDYFAAIWTTGGKLSICTRETPSGSAVWKTVGDAYGNSVDITLLINTLDSSYSMWVNGENVVEKTYSRSVVNYITDFSLYMESNYYNTVTFDNFKAYNARADLPPEQAISLDSEALTFSSLLNEEQNPLDSAVITSGLNLLTEGIYGSKIEWSTSDESVIATDGAVVCPSGEDAPNFTEVTLTATLTKGTQTKSKTFTFKVMKELSGDEDRVNADFEFLTNNIITDEDVNQIINNLNFIPQGIFGSKISWRSNHEETISPSGIVSRPNEGIADKSVTVWADISYGNFKKTKVFVFIVDNVNPTPDDLPWETELIMSDDFEDGVFDERILYSTGNNGEVNETDGALNFTRLTNSAVTGVSYYFDNDHNKYSGPLCVEFDMKKADARGNVVMRFQTTNTNGTQQEYMRELWFHDGTLPSDENTVLKTAEWVNFKFLLDTDKSVYSVWVNGVLEKMNSTTYTANVKNVERLYLSLEGGNALNCSMFIDNLKVYRCKLPDTILAAYDFDWLTQDMLVSESDSKNSGVIKENLSLPDFGKFGSAIEWSSSDESIILPDGTVKRPESPELNQNPEVVLTATIRSGNMVRQKNFIFTVVRGMNDEKCVDEDFKEITFSTISSDPPERVRTSLDLYVKGIYGSDVSWISSDEDVITASGRVIRPRSDSENAQVTLTAIIECGSIMRTKTFDITVLADEDFSDPLHMSDEEFFGKWNGNGWSIEGKWNYSDYPALSKVEEAVKNGDYTKAKEELLLYMKDRPNAKRLSSSQRDTNWSNLAADMNVPSTNAYSGEIYTSGDWKWNEADVALSCIKPGNLSSIIVLPWYNESGIAEIMSTNSPDKALHPRIKLTVNGVVKTYVACADATLRTGNFASSCYGDEEVLKVSFFGNTLGDETRYAVMKFDFSDLTENDKVTSAKLMLYSRHTPSYAYTKRLLIRSFSDSLWDESDIKWNDFYWSWYTYNGVLGGYDWKTKSRSDTEYMHSMVRFYPLPPLSVEFNITGDEKYAYSAIRQMQDFITDVGGWYPAGVPDARGQYYRSLDTSARNDNWVNCFDSLCKSRYMDAETCTAILKHIWDMGNSLYYNHADAGNWLQAEMRSISRNAEAFPEFSHSSERNQYAIDETLKIITTNYFDDGSYVEGTAGYSESAYTGFVNFKSDLENEGIPTGEVFDDLLLKAGYYNSMLFTPDGQKIQYGDADYGIDTSRKWAAVSKWYNDPELEFVSSLGASGREPEWTSKVFYDSGESFLRSSWSKDAMYLFTNVRQRGGHAHADDNHITAYAYGRILLNDAGKFSYTSADPMRKWGLSTRSHNTVEINDTSQRYITNNSKEQGENKINEFASNSAYDFLSSSTFNTDGFEHNRNIMFVKPYYWIVSDYITPEDTEAQNCYNQLWHMVPEAELSTDSESGQISSNFDTGANIVVASCDDDITVMEDIGWYNKTSGLISEAKYGFFRKEGIKGNATFDTVLVPIKDDRNATVKTERLNTGADTTVATAIKTDTVINGFETTGWYYLSHEASPYVRRTFGNYSTDGQMSFVLENSKNKEISTVIMKNASQVSKSDGTAVVSFGRRISDVSVEWVGTRLKVSSSENNFDFSSMKILTDGTATSLTINGKEVGFTINNGYIVTDGGDKESEPQSGGGNKGSFGASRDSSGGASLPATDGNTVGSAFEDISGHWAEKDIEEMFELGIVNGRDAKSFEPDGKVTRAEFVTLIVRGLGLKSEDADSSFADVKSDDWFSGYVVTALSNGLISEAEYFRPNDSITREEMSKIAVEAFKLSEEYTVPSDYEFDFADIEDISGWAVDYVKDGVYLGIIKGTDKGEFMPKANATRAEATVMIKRVIKK